MKDIVKIIDWEPKWSAGAPCPQIYSSEDKTFLIYYTTNDSFGDDEIAIVEFIHAQSYKFGYVNDEALSGHPLYKHGVSYYNAHLVENSSWIEEVKTVHKVHDRFNEEMWTKYKHIIFTFHDSVLEIIAEDYKVEVQNNLRRNVANEIIMKLDV